MGVKLKILFCAVIITVTLGLKGVLTWDYYSEIFFLLGIIGFPIGLLILTWISIRNHRILLLGIFLLLLFFGIFEIFNRSFRIGYFLGFLCFISGILLQFKINQSFRQATGKKMFLSEQVLFDLVIILLPLYGIIASHTIYQSIQIPHRGYISRIKAEQQSIATALESYYIEHNAYPLPDFDSLGRPVIPKILTTPVAYTTLRFYDPYKGFRLRENYEYGTNGQGWIVTSYGPDQKDGNSGIQGGGPLIEEKACSDKELGFPLETSGLTYDPTNGIESPGDVWRRGP